MKYILIGTVLLLTSLLLVTCSGVPIQIKQSTEIPVPGQKEKQFNEKIISDSQGAVTISIEPINLDNPGQTLDFDVKMDTHSIDLGMDISKLSILSIASGKTVEAVKWNAPMGGHHVEGTLSFPATINGMPLLENSEEITIRIIDVDAPARIFKWNTTK